MVKKFRQTIKWQCYNKNWWFIFQKLLREGTGVTCIGTSRPNSFLARLNRRLKWAFLIKICPSSLSSYLITFSSFSRTTGPISTNLGTKYPWVKGINVCSNEGPSPFPRGAKYEIAKIHWRHFKIFFSQESLDEVQPNLAHGSRGWRVFKFDQMKNHSILIK